MNVPLNSIIQVFNKTPYKRDDVYRAIIVNL